MLRFRMKHKPSRWLLSHSLLSVEAKNSGKQTYVPKKVITKHVGSVDDE